VVGVKTILKWQTNAVYEQQMVGMKQQMLCMNDKCLEWVTNGRNEQQMN
jgi:hypothetical protein